MAELFFLKVYTFPSKAKKYLLLSLLLISLCKCDSGGQIARLVEHHNRNPRIPGLCSHTAVHISDPMTFSGQ